MKNKIIYTFITLIFVFFVNYNIQSKIKEYQAIIIKCVDGDTIKLDNGKTIRILELDTFESKNNKQAKKQADKYNKSINEIISLGKKAKKLCDDNYLNKKIVVKEWKKDRYGRTLAYIDDYADFMIKNKVGFYVKPY